MLRDSSCLEMRRPGRMFLAGLLLVVWTAGCPDRGTSAATPAREVATEGAERGSLQIKTVVEGLNHPWGMAFLPDGNLLVTERNSGHLLRVTPQGEISEPLTGTPEVVAEDQGGLLDVALHPDFSENRLVYLSYASASEGGTASALGRGRLGAQGLEGFEQIFLQTPAIEGSKHFGGRIVFTRSGNLFLTLGERFQFEPAQDLSNHLGTIVRLQADGSAPSDNPFVDREGARPEIWSYGHRNVEAAAIHPESDQLYVAEMGPQGGDELNLVQPGANYGWPEVSWGRHYDGRPIPDPSTRPQFADAVRHWTPVISPSGAIFYTGDLLPGWRSQLLIGSLSDHSLVRLTVDGSRVTSEERLSLKARIRDVEQGPDGAVYLLTDEDNGKLLRLSQKI